MTCLAFRTALAALAVLALAVPAQGAYSYGSIVDKNDYDFQQAPSIRGTTPGASKFVLPCFLDQDSDGRVGMAETVYLVARTGATAGCGQVWQKDLRLSPFGPLAPGEVKADDADQYRALAPVGSPGAPGHAVRVFNQDGSVSVRKADTIYLDLPDSSAGKVGIGDLRLSPFGALRAGTRVQAGDADLNIPLDEFNGGSEARSLYTANMVFEFGKGWYLNADLDASAGGAVEEGDVRLSGSVPNPFTDIAASVASAMGDPGKVVDGLALSADLVPAGSTLQLHIRVKNPTTKVGSALVETRLDGILVDARGTPTLAKDQSATLVVSLTAPLEPGQHKVQAGETTTFFEVEAATASAAAATEAVAPASASIQKQGAPALSGLAMMATLGLALLVLRRTA